jgi:hypothetical protein
MQPFGDLEQARQKVLTDTTKLVLEIQALTAALPSTVSEGLTLLRTIRSSAYENLNQIQHECLILDALAWLTPKGLVPQDSTILWNPRQSGLGSEPDLLVKVGGRVILSAEVTTSEKPVGTIDSRMAKTLRKLSAMEGQLFYFVCTASMEQRARTKAAGLDAGISVVRIAGAV